MHLPIFCLLQSIRLFMWQQSGALAILVCICWVPVTDVIAKILPGDSSLVFGRVQYQQRIQFINSPSATVITTELLFGETQSLYNATRTDYRQDSSNTDIISKTIAIDVDVTVFTDTRANQLISAEYVITRLVTVTDTLRTLPWVLGDQQKKIGQFLCQNAFVTFRGREYEAWFTYAIPASFGPWKLRGLPGLILEAYDKQKEIQFSLTALDISPRQRRFIQAPNVANSVTYPAYKRQLVERVRAFSKMTQAKGQSVDSKFDTKSTVKFDSIELTD